MNARSRFRTESLRPSRASFTEKALTDRGIQISFALPHFETEGIVR